MATFGTTNKYINYSVNSQELSYDINSNTSVVRVGLMYGVQIQDIRHMVMVQYMLV